MRFATNLPFTMAVTAFFLVTGFGAAVVSADDVVFADFEGDNYGDWKLEGDCFGSSPAQGTLGVQQPVSGYQGGQLVNTFLDGDRTTGTATSPEFTIEKPYVNFLIGGGSLAGTTCLELLVDGEPRFMAVGKDRELLEWAHFDVAELRGQKAQLRIVDKATGGWGHINVDQITFSDKAKGPVGQAIHSEKERRAKMREAMNSLGCHEIVFCTREVDGDGHWYANFSYWSSNPERTMYHNGGRLCRLNLETGETTVLLEDLEGGVRDPQMHYDGQKILFSYRKGGQPYYHLYEINIDGTGLRQITDGPFDDLEPCYLPNDDIVFCSSRCNRMVNCWHVRVAIVYRCDSEGENIRPLSANIEQDNTPWVLPDGRILHQRWEYIDRSQVRYHHLWTMNPDGSAQMVFYGNMHPSTVMIDAKPIPNSTKIVASFSPGHGKKEHAGYVTVVDPTTGPDNQGAARRISNDMYRDPYALSEECFIVARNNDFGVLSGDGSYEPLWSIPQDWRTPTLWVHEPRPMRARPREMAKPDRVNLAKEDAKVLLDNVYIGRNMEGVEPGSIKKLLILEALPKPVNFSGGWEPISYGGTFTLARILGTVPIEEDGSAHFTLPALRSIFWVAMDENDMSVKRMQSFAAMQPGEFVSCIGCHEERQGTPVRSRLPMAMKRPADKIEPIEGIPGVFDFPRDIQPILDRHCVDCHDYTAGEKGGPRAGGVILTGDRAGIYSHAYYELSSRFEFVVGLNQDGNRPPYTVGTSASPLMRKLDGQHYDVKLSPEEKDMIRYWIETGAPYPGTYASLGCGMPKGESVAPIVDRRCAECHTNDRLKLSKSPSDIIIPGFPGGHQKDKNHPNNRRSSQITYNLTRPEYSLMLLAPLSKEAGGYGICRPLDAKEGDETEPVFADKNDPDYQAMLKKIEAGKAELERIKRFDMPGFRPNEHYLREMQVYGILPWDLKDTDPVDPYATDEKYWRSHWHVPE